MNYSMMEGTNFILSVEVARVGAHLGDSIARMSRNLLLNRQNQKRT
jgi:hypothetical protein